MDVDDVGPAGQAEQGEPAPDVVRIRPPVGTDRVQFDPAPPLELRPGQGSARAGDVDLEAARRKRIHQRDHVTGDATVERLRGDQEAAWLSHVPEGYCSVPPKHDDVTFNDLLRVFWQRKLLVLLVALLVVVPSYVATKLVAKQYQSAATLALTPKQSTANDLVLFGILDTVVPVYADAAEGVDLWRSATSTYQQIRRWAWGVSDVPYLTLRTLRAQHIPWYVRFSRLGWYIEEHLVWPSHWFLLTLGGMLPPLLNHAYAHSPLGVWQTAAFSTLLGLCLPSLVLAIAADLVLKLRSGEERNVWALLGGLLGFALLPFTGLAMVALPSTLSEPVMTRPSTAMVRA